eukprot:TRINITY_DN664_c0_g1_i13.p1 TRINITY_DN664_c0_g1~~TRINITY_DN664_c0_g1_i13.p1  ORF type:complete len:101 (-),score=15.39 TRINITY_DN664_c0_g1_i13:70-372(-)
MQNTLKRVSLGHDCYKRMPEHGTGDREARSSVAAGELHNWLPWLQFSAGASLQHMFIDALTAQGHLKHKLLGNSVFLGAAWIRALKLQKQATICVRTGKS